MPVKGKENAIMRTRSMSIKMIGSYWPMHLKKYFLNNKVMCRKTYIKSIAISTIKLKRSWRKRSSGSLVDR